MSSGDDIIKIGKKLDKMVASGTVDDATASDLLSTLKKFPMTFELLQKTRIGMKVNNFRKSCGNDGLISLSKALIKSWKKLLPDTSGGGANKTSNNTNLQRSNSSGSFSGSKDEDSRDSLANSDSQKSEAPSTPSSKTPEFMRQSSFPSRAEETNDSVRLKCRELLGRALKTSPTPDGIQDPDELAAAIEDYILLES
ncbi:hypothetical protein LSH36_196g05028 [Paralvinella palmiformis]|uniref:TFIIS N-terminal domain-containing protein n=1 Tax=Paralvinella palmiformis TaxID=53620 RepID=A0AAD9JS46_9ANNE|nr:hypothetical protein LSH36_196g05028 [Paralvinella palmiformis]